jgi:spermidine synthase
MIQFFEKEPYSPVDYAYEVESILYKGKSPFQEILVVKNPYFGNMLILDGVVQLTERDEFFYHEMLSQVAMHAHPDPRRVVIIGGGDGGAVREVLKHRTVERVYFVEMDEAVINISKKFFPALAAGLDDPRLELKIMDGADFMKKAPPSVDIIFIDPTDIIGYARSLFSEEFFDRTEEVLTEVGMLVIPSESIHFHLDVVIEVQKALNKAFPVVDLYTVPLATYPGNWWAFSVGSKKLDPRCMRRACEVETRYYDEEIHAHAFMPGKFYRKLLERKVVW